MATISPFGQLAGAIIMFFGLGFIPGWGLAKILNAAGVLRVPKEIELLGLDFATEQEAERARRDVALTERSSI